MKKLNINLTNCYGIKSFSEVLDFTTQNAVAIYAPNGSMKSSLAQTFKDLSDGNTPKDRVFLTRVSTCKILDENNNELKRENIFVIKPYDEVFGHSEKTSTLLVNSTLRKEYEQLHADIDKLKEQFLKTIKELSDRKS